MFLIRIFFILISATIFLFSLKIHASEWMWEYLGEGVTVVDIARTSDDGFVVALDKANANTVMIMKIDEDGELEWTHRYGNTSYSNYVRSIAAFDSGNIIFVGSSNGPYSAGLHDGWVVILTDQGTVYRSHLYGGSGWDSFQQVRVVDGNILVVGARDSLNHSNAWAMKLDSSGDSIWERTFNHAERETEFSDVRRVFDDEDEEDGYVVVGTYENANSKPDAWITRINEDGTFYAGNSQKAYPSINLHGHLGKIVQVRDVEGKYDGFVVSGTQNGWQVDLPCPDTAYVMKVEDDLLFDWRTFLCVTDNVNAINVETEGHDIENGENGYITNSGWAESPLLGGRNWLASWAVSDGSLDWSRAHGEEGHIFSRTVATDEGYTVASGFYNGSAYNTRVIQTNSLGQIPKCTSVTVGPQATEQDTVTPYNTNVTNSAVASDHYRCEIGAPIVYLEDRHRCPAGCVVFVDENQTANTPDGITWEYAFNDLKDGLEEADALITAGPLQSCDVWVKEGTYYAYDTTASDAFRVYEKTYVWGGFESIQDDYYFEYRDVDSYETTLSGYNSALNNQVFHVVVPEDETYIDGFTISGGDADGNTTNGYGGGMYNNGVSPEISNCTFLDNNADDYGGAVYNYHGQPVFKFCEFSDNTGGLGGAAMNYDAGGVFWQTKFIGNTATVGSGGALYNYTTTDGYGSPAAWDCVFHDNSSANWASAIMNQNAGTTTTAAWVIGTEIHNNTAGYGGAIYNYGTNVYHRIVHTTVVGNAANYYSGAIVNDNSSPVIVNSILWNNTSGAQEEIYNGGAVSMSGVVYNDIEGKSGISPAVPASNIDVDPDWANYATDDFHVNEAQCIDSGADIYSAPYSWTWIEYDPEYLDRNDGSGFDMGAYEN